MRDGKICDEWGYNCRWTYTYSKDWAKDYAYGLTTAFIVIQVFFIEIEFLFFLVVIWYCIYAATKNG
jgi:hypothetical protein